MKFSYVRSSMYIDFGVENNDKDPKFEVGVHVRISDYENIFFIFYTPNCSEELFVIKKVKNIMLLTYVIEDLNLEQVVGMFYEKELQKTMK